MPRFDKEIFFPLQKRDEDLQEIWGIATEEVPDCSNEICDYETSKPYFLKWSEHASKLTNGESRGNLREMHDLIAAGKILDLECDDTKKQIRIHAKVVDPTSWLKVKESILPCLSIGGSYISTWPDPTDSKYTRFTCSISEISLVDLGAVPTAVISGWKAATVEVIKAGGVSSTVKLLPDELPSLGGEAKISPIAAPVEISKASSKTKRVDGEDLSPSAFLIVGDRAKTSTWKLPVHFSTEAKSKKHVRLALQLFSTLEDVSEAAKRKAWSKLKRLAERYGIEVEEDTAKAKQVEVAKGLYSVSRLADILESIRYLESSCTYEGDYENDDEDYAMAARLHGWLEDGAEIIPDLLAEELAELTAKAAITKGVSMNDLEKKKAANLGGIARKMAAAHEKMAECHKDMSEDSGDMMEAHKACMGKAKKAEGAAAGGDESSAHEFHTAGVAFHKAAVAMHTKLHKAHTAAAEHMTKMAEGYEAGAAAPEKEQPEHTEKAEEAANLAKAAAEKVAADAAKKAADEAAAAVAKAAAEKDNPLAKSVTDLGELVKSLQAKLTEIESKPVAVPSGLSFVPRGGMAKAATETSAVAIADNDCGI